MRQETKLVIPFLLFICMAISAVAVEGHQSLTNLVNYLTQAETVTLINPTNAAKELGWLAGKWECRDRALRILPLDGQTKQMPTRTGDYPWLKTIEITHEELRESATNAMVLKIFPQCSFQDRPAHFGASKSERVAFMLKGRNLNYREKPSHLFFLKREKAAQPRWLLLENQESGELLLFERTSPQA